MIRSSKSARLCVYASDQLRRFSLLIVLALLIASAILVGKVDAFERYFEINFGRGGEVKTFIPKLESAKTTDFHATTATQECVETATLHVALTRDLTSITVPGTLLTVSGTSSGTSITRCPTGRQEKQLESFTWNLESPRGSNARLENTTSLKVRFTPDRIGRYIVKLKACPNKCNNRLITGRTSTEKPIWENVEVGPAESVMTIDVVAAAQMPPLYIPNSLPTVRPETSPEHYADPRSHCGSDIHIGIGNSPQWFTTKTWITPTPRYELAEGRVYHTLIARKDHPASHHSQDANAMIELDPPYRRLLVDDKPEDKSRLLPFGGLQIEWERDQWPEAFRHVRGDRISALGHHVIDCGHDKYTELHPAIAVAVHRPRPVVLPAQVSFGDCSGIPCRAEPTGANVVVPGIVTDVWANLNGGQALDCENAAIHQPVLTTLPGGLKGHTTCVRQPTTAGVNFDFYIFLPPNPAERVKDLGLSLPVRPGLYFETQNHPDAAALGARSDVSWNIIEKHLEGQTPFVKVRVALSEMNTGQKFAKRFVAAWVYPDHTGNNFGLRAFRIKFNQLIVRDDGDPFPKGDGEWRLWAVIPSSVRPWTMLIECDGGCVEERTYDSRSRIFERGAFDSDGALTDEVLLFNRQFGSFQLTGFEDDVLVSDDVGNVFETFNSVFATRRVSSKCVDGGFGISTSGCAGYTVDFGVEVGRTPVVATLSPAMSSFAQRLLVRSPFPDLGRDIVDTERYRLDGISRERSALTVERRGEVDSWQLSTARLKEAMLAGNPEPMVKAIRARVLKLLGPLPSEKTRQEIAFELQELKQVVPPALYQKYLCDLETGRPCTAQEFPIRR